MGGAYGVARGQKRGKHSGAHDTAVVHLHEPSTLSTASILVSGCGSSENIFGNKRPAKKSLSQNRGVDATRESSVISALSCRTVNTSFSQRTRGGELFSTRFKRIIHIVL